MAPPAVGIDLGTSNTVLAVVRDDEAIVIPDRQGQRIHPSVVSFHPNGTVLVGQEAKRRRVIDPRNTVYSAKRLIGRSYRSEEVAALKERVSYELAEGDNEQPLIVARGNQYTVPEISAFILRHVRRLAEQFVGEPVEDAVITVPANFNDAQRESTRAAGRIAGLNVLRILNEPTAAALAYGYGRGIKSRVAIYDFGGGTFDITTLQLDDRIFEVLSTAGDTFLGGDDIDDRIVNHMVDLFLKQTRVDLRYNVSAMARLRGVAEQIKCQLSKRSKAAVQVQEIAYGEGGRPLDLSFTLKVDELTAMAKMIVQRTFPICDEALRLAKLAPTQIDDIVLVGGSTRMPLVQESVRDYFGAGIRTDINPDEVVAVGAAIQATALASGDTSSAAAPSSILLDVTPRALGLAVVGGYADVIIERNAQIPVEQTRVFSTSQDNQETVRIQVCQGESNVFSENQLLGELVLDGLRPAPRGTVKIAVTLEIDTNGILQVRALDCETRKHQSARVQIIGTTSEAEVERLSARQAQLPAPTDVAPDDEPTTVR